METQQPPLPTQAKFETYQEMADAGRLFGNNIPCYGWDDKKFVIIFELSKKISLAQLYKIREYCEREYQENRNPLPHLREKYDVQTSFIFDDPNGSDNHWANHAWYNANPNRLCVFLNKETESVRVCYNYLTSEPDRAQD